jgi:hypothetical protein
MTAARAAIAGCIVAIAMFLGLLAVAMLLFAGAGPGGFAPGARLGLTQGQTDQARRALQVADRLHAGPLAVLAEIVAALGESDLEPVPNAGGSGYCGVFQADPKNLACDDTEGQARAFLQGGHGFQAGGAIAYARQHPNASPGRIATLVEASGRPAAFYDAHAPQARTIIAAWRTGAAAGSIPAGLTPKQVIDTIVLPIANRDGIPLTPAQVEAANAVHGPTKDGGRSDHQGPPDVAWAADMSNGTTTPQEDQLAADLAHRFKIPWQGAGLASVIRGGYRFQLIYRTFEGGDHYNHVHFGCRRL